MNISLKVAIEDLIKTVDYYEKDTNHYVVNQVGWLISILKKSQNVIEKYKYFYIQQKGKGQRWRDLPKEVQKETKDWIGRQAFPGFSGAPNYPQWFFDREEKNPYRIAERLIYEQIQEWEREG